MKMKDSYLLTRMGECIASHGEAKVFKISEGYIGYWKVLIGPKDRPQNSFVCYSGTYQYTRMPLVITNAPDTYQHEIDMILTKFKYKVLSRVIDDVSIY